MPCDNGPSQTWGLALTSAQDQAHGNKAWTAVWAQASCLGKPQICTFAITTEGEFSKSSKDIMQVLKARDISGGVLGYNPVKSTLCSLIREVVKGHLIAQRLSRRLNPSPPSPTCIPVAPASAVTSLP